MMARGTGIVQADTERAARWLTGHLRYLQYRQRSPQEGRQTRRIFSATGDQVRLGEVLDRLIGTPRPEVVIHKLILSTEEERITDWRAWTRQVMRLLSEPQGQPTCWLGVLHQNTATPHVHVVLAGYARPAAHAPLTLLASASRQRPPRKPLVAEAFLGSSDHLVAEQEAHP